MAYVERIRDMIAEPLLEEIVRQRTAADGTLSHSNGAGSCRMPKHPQKAARFRKTFLTVCASQKTASDWNSIPTKTRRCCR